MLVRSWMIRDVVAVTPDTSIANARRLMDTYEVRHLPVVRGDRVVGVVSDRDLREADIVRRPVASLMSAPPRTIRPTETIARASGIMIAERIGALPVVEEGRLVGICSLVDCLRAYLAAERRQAGSAARHPAPEDDPDLWLRIPMPQGDPRPGRRARPVEVITLDDPGRQGPLADVHARAREAV